MQFAPTVATEIIKMFLPRWDEFCCVRVIAEGGAHGWWGCPFREKVGAKRGEWEYAWLGLLAH